MSIHSTSAFKGPLGVFKSLYLDDDIRVAAETCTGVEHHIGDITAFLVEEFGCSIHPERLPYTRPRTSAFLHFQNRKCERHTSFSCDFTRAIASRVMRGRAINFSYLYLLLQLRNSRRCSSQYQHLCLHSQSFQPKR